MSPSRAANGAVASWDEKRSVPTFFWADRSAAASSAKSPLAAVDPEKLARVYVDRNAALYRLPSPARDAMYVRHVHDTGRGGIIVLLGQRVDGLEVFETEMKVLMDRQGSLVAIGGNLSSVATPKAKGTSAAFAGGPARAISIALGDAFGLPVSSLDLIDLKRQKAGYGYYDLPETPAVKQSGLRFATPARARKVFYAMPARLVPAYYLEVNVGHRGSTSSELYGYVVDATTGELLVRRNLVQDAAYKYRVWADAAAPYTPTGGPQADYAPHPTGTPDGSVPPYVSPILITMDGFNKNPNNTFDPWLPAGATQSTGNNIDAYADIGGNDGFDAATDVRATPSAPGTFDRTYDVMQAPAASQNQLMASVTQLFYTTNWLHDYWYDSGFNEGAGVAQTSNFGRGGVEGDALLAEAQDFSGTDNANMQTPADGEHPRMQMYVWTAPAAGPSTLTVQPGNLSPTHQDASFGANTFNTTATLILASDGVGPDVNDACENITNNVAGKIALINRGTCTFESKVLKAQQAGAVGVLIANNQNPGPTPMGDDPATNGVTIGSFGITLGDGNTLKTMLNNGAVTVTMSRTGEPLHDGSIDNDTVAHEWGHYIHHRLVNCGATQCAGQSEGWGDTDAMIMKVREGDNVTTGTYALSIYATAAFNDSGYFGIRRFPYTRDKTKNGLTFKHITNGVALPPGPQNQINVPNFEPHDSGEVWAMMMFQAYSGLIIANAHPFPEIKRRMADYVVAGMMMAPVDPTFTEQRDGILAAAAAADPADFAVLAQGFADRGAGTCAVSPPRDSQDGSGVVEDFKVSGQQQLVKLTVDDSVKSCDGDGILDGSETGKVHISVRNTGGVNLTATTATVTANNPAVTFPGGNSVMIPTITPYQTVDATVEVALDKSVSATQTVQFTVQIDNSAACVKSTSNNATVKMHYDDTPMSSTVETVDADNSPWTKWGAPGYENLVDQVWTRDLEANGNYRFYGQNFPAHSDTAIVTPDLVVGAGNFTVKFDHAHDFESSPQNPGQPDTHWDGGLIEVTSDGGASWQDVSMFASPGYEGTIAAVMGADNPLGNRQGYVGQNPSWPSNDTVTLGFGTKFANKTVKLRFRIGTDAAAGAPDYLGWYIDNISVEGTTNKPFDTVGPEAGGCNLMPIAAAGPDLTVDEGNVAKLDGTASSDPEGAPITYSWTQTAGPNVALSDPASATPQFTAPLVDADTTLTFKLTVSDGVQMASDSVDVLVKDLGVGTGGSAGAGGAGGEGGSAGSMSGGAGGGFNLDEGGGCGCRVPGDVPRGGAGLVSALGLLALAMRRRRRGAKG